MLTVISRGPNDATNKNSRWWCQCACGNKTLISKTSLTAGTRSCGCIVPDILSTSNIRHGNATRRKGFTPEYLIWQSMHQRCANKNDPYYGQRGIQVCERWSGVNGFANFHSDMGDRPKGLQIDRIDTDKGYSPDNCRWTTPAENSRNKRSNVYIEIDGVVRTLTDWSKVLNISCHMVKKLHGSNIVPTKCLTRNKFLV